MRKFLFLAAVICLSTVAAFSQAKTTDFSGTWMLDIPKSKIDERMRIEAMTMTVAQTAKELKVTTETKRMAPSADAPQGAGRGRGSGGGDATVAYSLDGKETVVEIDGPNGKMPVKYMGGIDAGKATLSSSRTFTTPMGEMTATGKDVWSLSDDGKVLTVVREQASPRGSSSATLVFVKK